MTSQDEQRARGDAVVGRTLDEERRPLVCFVCAERFAITFNFCLQHKDEYEALKKSASSEYQRGYEAGLEAAAKECESGRGADIPAIFRVWCAAAIRALPRKGSNG